MAQAAQDAELEIPSAMATRFIAERGGEVVGYMVGIEYYIDDTLFDGGGENLYFNLNGELVYDAPWWG